jgi:hypothetical protein
MKYKITTLFILISFVCLSQNIKESELIGVWKVQNVIGEVPKMPKKEQQQKMNSFLAAFKKATFEFKKDHSFILNIDFIELSNMMKNVHWKLKNDSQIMIQELKDKGSDKYQLMGIKISQKEGKTFFIMTESPFVLEMKKN